MKAGEERIDFPQLGELTIRRDPAQVVFQAVSGEGRRFSEHPILRESGVLRFAVEGRGACALLGRREGHSLHLFDARRQSFSRVALRERLPGVTQLEIVASRDLFLARSENQLIAVETDGRERWCVECITYDWRFVSHSDDSVWFADSEGNLLGFDSASGQERL